jgi:hypothetical protein
MSGPYESGVVTSTAGFFQRRACESLALGPDTSGPYETEVAQGPMVRFV